MATYLVAIQGDTNKAVKRDARIAGITVEDLLTAWLLENFGDSLLRYQLAIAAKLADAVDKAAPTALVGDVKASINVDLV